MAKYYFVFSEGSKVNQLICAFLINLSVFVYGTSIGWMSPTTLLLQSPRSPAGTPFSDAVVSWMAAAPYMTCVFFDFIFAAFSDRFGRKMALLAMSLSCVVCWAILLGSTAVWAFILARALSGLAMAAAYVVATIYTKEISEDSIRGTLGTLVILAQTSGNLLLYIMGDIMSYTCVLWVCVALPSAHFLLFLTMPESPSYLVKRRKIEEAIKVTAWLRCRSPDDPVVKSEVDFLKKEQDHDDQSSSFAFKAIIQDQTLRRAFWIAVTLTLAREVCGVNPVLNFAGSIFEMAADKSSVMLTPNQQAIVLGMVQVAGSAVASSLVDSTGRKPLLLATSLVSGLSMCALASWFLASSYGAVAPGWVPVTALCLCIFCDAAGLQPLSVVVMNEIFSFKYRSTVSAITMATASATDFLQLLFFKPLATLVGVHVSFFFFGAVCLLAAVYVIFVVPETKMRTVEEIYKDLGKKKDRKEEKGEKHVDL